MLLLKIAVVNMKFITIIGARPQIIKAAAISRAIKEKYSNIISEIIVHTGQHYDEYMSKVFFEELNIPKPNYNLDVGSNSHGVQTARMIEGIEEILVKEKPDYILLYGDTNSTLAGAIAASKIHIPIVHVEAGLRSFNKKMPEEINRIVCDHVSTYLFSPTKAGFDNLINEGFKSNHTPIYTADNPAIFHCGDIMYDNSLYFAELAKERSQILEKYDLESGNFVLATIHRDHNTDIEDNLVHIFEAFLTIADRMKVMLPLHPRTKNKLNKIQDLELKNKILNHENLVITDPISFLDIIQLERNSKIVITDSGGVQKEAYFFNKPCLIMRPETEWVEILETGMAKLVSANYDLIIKEFDSLIKKEDIVFPSIFGDGKSAQFICKELYENLKRN